MSFESPKTDKKIPSSFSSPEFTGPGAHEMSVMSGDSTMDSIATSSFTESKIIRSVNTHDSGFGDSTLEDTQLSSKKHNVLVTRTEHLISVCHQAGQPDITLMTRIENNKEKSRLKSVEEDVDVKQTDGEVITIVKTTKLTTKVEKLKKKKRKNSKKIENGQDLMSKSVSTESNTESVDDSAQNQSDSIVYQVDINKSTEELVYQTMNKKSDEITTTETKQGTDTLLDLNSTVLDCEEILSNYSANNANNLGSPRHEVAEKEPEPAVVVSEPVSTAETAKKKGFFTRFRSKDKESNGKRKLDLKSTAETPSSPSKHLKTTKHYNLEKYELLSVDEKERILYQKKECVDLINKNLIDLINDNNVNAIGEMVSRTLDLLRHDRIESFDKLAQELDREYNIANAVVLDSNQIQSVFNRQMKKLIIDEKILLDIPLDKSRTPCEEFIEFEMGREDNGANLNLISENLISCKQDELIEQANQSEMDQLAKKKCPTPPSTPQNELGSGDGAALLKESSVMLPTVLNNEILNKVGQATATETSVQAPRQKSSKPKRKSTLSSCFTCAGVLKMSDDESRPQQQKEKKKVVVPQTNEQEVPISTSAADTIVKTTLVTHDLDKRPQDVVESVVDVVQLDENDGQNEENFVQLDNDDDSSKIENKHARESDKEECDNKDTIENKINENGYENENEKSTNEEDKKEENLETVTKNETKEESKSETSSKKSKNKKKKKKKKSKLENLEKDQQVPITVETEKNEIENNSVAEEQTEVNVDLKELSEEESEKIQVEYEKNENEQDNERIDIRMDQSNIQVVETLKMITEKVVQGSEQVVIEIKDIKLDNQKEHEIEIKQEIGIDQEVPIETDLYKPAVVQQKDPVVLPDPREKVISLAVSDHEQEVPVESVKVAKEEVESEEDASKISCFSCRGKKATKKSKSAKTPIKSAQPPITETVTVSQRIEPRPVDINLFVGLDNTDKKMDNQSVSSAGKNQNILSKDESGSNEAPNITPSLIGSTSIEQQTIPEIEVKQENSFNIEKERDIVVQVIYESKQEEKIQLEEEQNEIVIIENDAIVDEKNGQDVEKNLENNNLDEIDDLKVENFDKKLEDNLEETVAIAETIEIETKEDKASLKLDKPNLSNDPVVLPDPSERQINVIVEATPVIEPMQPIEQIPRPTKKNSSFACCGGKKSKNKKSKKTSKIDLPLINIMVPKEKDAAKFEEASKPEVKVEEKNAVFEANDSYDLPRAEKYLSKDWAKGLDRTESSELIRREPEISNIKITDNLDEQLTNVTIEITSNVDLNEIQVVCSQSSKTSELEVPQSTEVQLKEAETFNVGDQIIQSIQSKTKDNEEENLNSIEIKCENSGQEIKDQSVKTIESDQKSDQKDLNVKTSLTNDSPQAIIRIEREPDHAFIPDCTKDRVFNIGADQSPAKEEKAAETSLSNSKNKKKKNKKSKRTSRIDLPLINILTPKEEKKQLKPTETRTEDQKTVHLEQNVAKVVNLGNDLDKPAELVEKDTIVDIKIPNEVDVKKIDVNLQIDTAEVNETPEINIAIEQSAETEQKTEDHNDETQNEKAMEQKSLEEQAEEGNVEIQDDKAMEQKFLEEQAKIDEKNEEKVEIVEITLKVEEAESKEVDIGIKMNEDKSDVVDPVVSVDQRDIKKLDHQPDVVVLPEVDISARIRENQSLDQQVPNTANDNQTKVIEAKKTKNKKKRTSKIDLPLIDIFGVKETKIKTPKKIETNVYVDMPIIDLVSTENTGKNKQKNEQTSCFACKSKKSKKSKTSKSKPAEKQIPKIIEPVDTESDAKIISEDNDQSNSASDVKETKQINDINVVPLIVSDVSNQNAEKIDSQEKTSLEIKENDEKITQIQEIDNEKCENLENDQQVPITVETEKNEIENNSVAEEQTEVNVDLKELSEEESEKIQVEYEKNENEQDNERIDIRMDQSNIQVVETLKMITEKVVQGSEQVVIEIKDIKLDNQKEHEIEIKQEIGIDQEVPIETDLYKPAVVQQKDPVVLPDPREKVISLAVSDHEQEVPVESVKVAKEEVESEEDASKISCFSCRGKKATKKSKSAKTPITKPEQIKSETITINETHLTPQIKSVNLELFKGLDKPSSLSEIEKVIDYNDSTFYPPAPIEEKQSEENSRTAAKTLDIELPSDLTATVDLPPTSPTKEQILQVKLDMEQILEPAPLQETNIPTIKIDETFISVNSPPVDLATPPKKPPRGHLDTTVLDECDNLIDQNIKMNVKEALIKVNSPDEDKKLDETKFKREKKSKTSIIDLPLIDILVPKESKKNKSEKETKTSNNLPNDLQIEPKGTMIELNQPDVELFIEKSDLSKNNIQVITLSNEDKKLLKAKRNEICEYLKQRSGYKLDQLIEQTSQATSKKELKAKEKLADKLYKRSIKLMTKTRVNPMSFGELSKKLEKVVSPKTGAGDIEKCVDQIRTELNSGTLFSCLRDNNEKKKGQETKKEQDTEKVVQSEIKKEEVEQESVESRKASINSEYLLRFPNLSWREANERARILFYKGQIPSIHYNEKRDSFHVSRLINANEKMSEVPVTDDDVKKLLNSCGLYWNGESIGLIDKSEEIFKNAQQEAFDILNSIQVSESIQITENHCETVEQSKINYIY